MFANTRSVKCLFAWLALVVGSPAIGAPMPADYEVIFDATWSAVTHPDEFPSGPHFSPWVGGTHDENAVFWAPGGIASSGIERMAERGQTAPLVSEVDDEIAAGFADQSLVGNGVVSPGTTSLSFTVDPDFPQLTLVSMLAPSPDWFVGIDGLLLLDQGVWVEEIVLDLFTWDAGTDDGPSYSSPNDDADPQLPIALQGYPLAAGVPVGTLTIRRVPEPAQTLQLAVAIPLLAWLYRRRRAG